MEPEVNTAAGKASSPPEFLRNGGSSSRDSVGSRPSQDELQHSPPPAQHPDGKKRRVGPGSRGVANLTPEQLAKKRANGAYKHTILPSSHRLELLTILVVISMLPSLCLSYPIPAVRCQARC